MLVLDGNLKPIYHSRKNCYKRQLSQMNIPFKKRKLFDRSSVSNSDGFIRSSGSNYSPENGMNQNTSGPRDQEGMSLNCFLIFQFDCVFPMNLTVL